MIMLKPLTMWITTNCGNFLKRWEYQTILPVSWETCMWFKKQQNWTWTMDWFKIGKGVQEGCILSSCFFNFYAECIMWNAGLDELQARIKVVRTNISNLRYADDTTLMVKSEGKLKSLLIRVKEESEKSGLKLSIQKTKIMASVLITLWQIDGEKVERVADFIFLGSKITGEGDCTQEIKRCLLLGRKTVTNLDSILKNRDIILPTKVCIVKAMVFPVAMYGCWELDHKEDWAPKNWCFQIVLLDKSSKRPLDTKEIKSVNPKGNQFWIFIWRTNAEVPVLWPPDVKSWFIGKNPHVGKDWSFPLSLSLPIPC